MFVFTIKTKQLLFVLIMFVFTFLLFSVDRTLVVLTAGYSKVVVLMLHILYIMKICLFKYTENLPPKNENFQIENSDICHISAQNRLWVLIRTALSM